MTTKLSPMLLGFILLIVLASPTLASTQPASTHTLTQEDIAFAFGPEANLADFTPLSPQEMAATDGAWTFLALRQAFYGGALHVWSVARRFGSYWPTRVQGRGGIWESGNWRFTLGHLAK